MRNKRFDCPRLRFDYPLRDGTVGHLFFPLALEKRNTREDGAGVKLHESNEERGTELRSSVSPRSRGERRRLSCRRVGSALFKEAVSSSKRTVRPFGADGDRFDEWRPEQRDCCTRPEMVASLIRAANSAAFPDYYSRIDLKVKRTKTRTGRALFIRSAKEDM